MGSDESHLNVSLTVRDKLSHKAVSTDHNFRTERTALAELNRDPSAYQPKALPLGQTGSHGKWFVDDVTERPQDRERLRANIIPPRPMQV